MEREKPGIDESIPDPLHNEKILQILGESVIWDIQEAILDRRPDDPVFYYECPLIVNKLPRWYRITVQTKWIDDKCSEIIGKAIDIHYSRMQIDALERKASYDVVTELLNHAGAREQIRHRMKMVLNGDFALVIFDLDHFKSVNDTYGHIFGDRILRGVAEKARQSIRGNGIIARIGGDEFLIFIENRTEAEMEKVVDRIFNDIVGVYDDIPVSVSLGAAKTSLVGYEYSKLFHAADQALYSAKRSGRGRYLFYDDSMKETFGVVFLTVTRYEGVQVTLKECYAAIGGDYEDVIARLRSDRMVRNLFCGFWMTGAMNCFAHRWKRKTMKGSFGRLTRSRAYAKISALPDCLNQAAKCPTHCTMDGLRNPTSSSDNWRQNTS